MKKKAVRRFLIAFSCCCFVLSCSFLAYFLIKENNLNRLQQQALQTLEEDIGTYDENTIVLTDTNASTAKSLAQKLGASLRITSNGSYATLTLPEGQTVKDVYENKDNRELLSKFSLDYYSKTSEVEEESYERLPSAPNYSVTDTLYSNQSYIDYVNVGNAWNSYRGSGITVAVIDTGIDTDHPEFAGKISEYSYNASEDKIVKDYTLENGEYDWSLIEDEQGHGTAVSGVIASSMNGDGVVGIAPEVTLLVIKAECDENGGFYRASDLVFGLYYAVERDVDVVNMSFGSYVPVNPFAQATKLAVDSDIICVAAAGNDATTTLCYPAADENVIGVGALAENSWELAAYSNYGENSDIVAPGTTYTTLMGGGYGVMKGTSLASPIVAGAAALLKSQDRYLEFSNVEELLYASCYDLGSLGEDWYFGYGALDINALICEERGTVTFDMLTDEVEDIKQLFIRNHTLQNIPEPERNYAVFDGWYYDIDCQEELNLYEDIWNGDLTLYAKWANEDDAVPYTYVTLEDGTVEIRSYTGHRRYITIPEKIDGKVVSSIGDFAFDGQKRLRQVNLPSGLINIGLYAFRNCNNLTEIILPDGVKNIGEYAFQNTVRMQTVGMNSNIALESIGSFAFSGSGITKFDVTKNVTALEGSAFFGATSLKSINVSKENTNFRSESGVLFNATGSKTIAFPAGLNASYVIPESVTEIGDYAFGYAKLNGIDLGGVQRIGNYAFAYSSLEGVVIPNSVTAMGQAAFAYNFNLKTATIGSGLTSISAEAFAYDFALSEIIIPANITVIGKSAFASTGLTKVTFAENSNLMEIGGGAFSLTAIKQINLPASLVVIGSEAFAKDYSLSKVTFATGSNLQYIGGSAFESDLSLRQITLPDSLLQIGDYAFKDSGLTGNVTIPANVSVLGAGAFASCHNLTEIKVDEANANYLDVNGVVYNINKTTLVAYPAGNTATEYTLETTTETVYDSAFYGAANLNYAYLPQSLASIQRYAFYEVSNLQSIDIPDNVTQISNYAFANDYNLHYINFTENSKLPRISFAAFAYTGIYSFRVPANVSTVAQYAFEGCNNLTSITFAANSKLDIIPAYMFKGAEILSIITFENGSALTSISAHGFEGMSALQSIDFGDANITNIDNYAFRYCDSLQTLTIPSGVTYIGRFAFYGDKALTRLDIPESVEYIGRYAFYGAENLNVYFASSNLPEYLQENWDKGIAGYYVGVTNVVNNGDWQYATLSDGGISIISYTGTDTVFDLTTLDLGGDIKQIGGYAFYRSGITSITLPETLTQIQRYAFAYSNIQSIIIPANVSFIGQYAFYHTTLSEVTFAQDSTLQKVEQYAFAYNEGLNQITIPASVNQLGTYAFYNSALESVTFESGSCLTTIPAHAFASTKLNSVTIPDSVNYIDDNAFRDCLSLNTVTFSSAENLQVHANAFYNTGITTLNLPANLEYIGEYAFIGLRNLTAYNVDENNKKYKSVDGALYSKDGKKLIAFPAGREGSFTVPKSIEIIGFGAFENTKLESIDFESDINLLTLGYRAFYNAQNLATVSIPASVVSIDYYAFAMCEKLETVTFAKDNKLTGIYEGAFYGCKSLKNIVIPDSIIEISDFAFYGCSSLTRLPISETSGLKGIYDYAFAYTGITELTIPETVIDIGAYAFRGAKLKSVVIPDTNAKQLIIGIGAFADCNDMVEITLPFIGASFEDTEITWFGYIFGAGGYEANSTYVPESIETVTITEGISFVGRGAFYGASNLQILYLPASIIKIYNESFVDCTAKYSFFNEISLDSTEMGLSTQYFTCMNHGVGYINAGLSGQLRLASGIERIEINAFTGCIGLTDLILPEGVTYINMTAFQGEVGISSIVLPSTLTEIESNGFGALPNLKIIYNNSDLLLEIGSTTYGEIAQYAELIIDKEGNKHYSEGINDVELIDTIDGFHFEKKGEDYILLNYFGKEDTATLPLNINGHAYSIYKMWGIRNLIIPEGFESIDNYAFLNCTSLESIVFPSSLSNIGVCAFEGCENLISIKFSGNSLDNCTLSIQERAFAKCNNLKAISFPVNLVKIGSDAFNWCTQLSYCYIPQSVNNIGTNAFYSGTSLGVSEDNNSYTLQNGILYNKIMSEIISVTKDCKEVQLPETISCIPNGAFASLSLSRVVIPSTVTNMGSSAFINCSIEELVLKSNALSGCSINGCDVGNLIIKDFVEEISNQAFYDCKIHKIQLSENNEHFVLENNILYNAGRTSIICLGWEVESVTILNTITDISNVFVGHENLREVIFEENTSLVSIGVNSFSDTNITSIKVPEGVETIESYAFFCCYSLLNIYLPSTLQCIESGSFSNCLSLEVVYNNSDLLLDFSEENNEYSEITIYAQKIIDKEGNEYSKYDNYSTITTTDKLLFVVQDGNYKLRGYLGEDKTITLPLTVLGNNYIIDRFRGGKATEIIIPEGITVIDNYAFFNNSSYSGINSISLPKSLKKISYGAFAYCSSLINISIYDGVETIEAGAFRNTAYYNDESNWEDGCLYLGNYLLEVDDSVKSFTVDQNVLCIAGAAFERCYKLTKLAIGGNHWFLLYSLTNMETLVLTELPTEHDIYGYFGSTSNIPLTLKNIVLKKGCDIRSANMFENLSGVKIYVEEYKENVMWDDDFPGWNNGNKVYYGGEWITAEFKDTDGNIISSDYYTISQVIRQPYVSPIVDGATKAILLGWDLDGDGIVDSVPATSTQNITATAVMVNVDNTFTVNYYGFNGELLASQIYVYGTEITLPEEPTKQGYSFNSWSGYISGMKVTEDVNLYSVWTHDGDGHSYGMTTVLPTCTEQGYDKYVCSICGDEYHDNYVGSLGHTYGEWIIETAATCTADGLRYRICSVCGEREEEIIEATGHSYIGVVTKEPTCTEYGEITYTCEHCSDVVVEQLNKSEHNYHKEIVSKSWILILIDEIPNVYFGYEGENAYYYRCADCGSIMTSDGIDSLTSAQSACEHIVGEWETSFAPSCVNGISVRKCTVCDKVIESKTLAANGEHVYGEWYESVAPDCVTEGEERHDCIYCDHYETRELSALGHTPAMSVEENRIEATCTVDGHYDSVVYCSVCGEELSREEKTLTKLGHDLVHHEAKAPTCTEIGWEAYDTCSRCDYTTYVELPELGHTPAQAVEENRVEATCTTDGHYDSVVYCSVCGEELSREEKTLTKLGHDLVHHEAKAPTCTEIGWEAYDTCSRCDYTTYVELPELGHTPAQAVEENRVEATCTVDGHYDSVVYCSVCGEELSREEKTLTKLGHDLVHHEAKAPTCTEIGWEAYDTCSRCDYTTYSELPANGHTHAQAVEENRVEATCTVDGHYDSVVYCSVCGEELSREEKALTKLGHDLVHHEAKAPTCTEIGWEAYDTCSRCDYTTYSELPANGHDFGEWMQTKAPTYTEIGEERRECNKCNYFETRETDKLSRVRDFVNAVNSLSDCKNEDLFIAIKDAIVLYNLLEESEKAQVSEAYGLLITTVSSYNQGVELQNDEHEEANENALTIFAGTITCLATLLYFLKRKMF